MPEAPTPPVAPIGSELAAEDESFADLVQEFLDGLARRLADLEQALAEADCQRLRMLAHQLKGSGGGYGYPILTQQAAELERVAITGVVDECRRAVEALRSLVSRLVAKAPG